MCTSAAQEVYVHICSPGTQEAEAESGGNLGYIARPCLRKQAEEPSEMQLVVLYRSLAGIN